jgi:hypothetical protein
VNLYPLLPILGYLTILIGSAGHSLLRTWNRSLIAFSLQSLGVGLVAWQIAPLPLAIAKCIVGWLAAALIAITFSREGTPPTADRQQPVARFFRSAILLLILSAVIAMLPQIGAVFRNPPIGILFMVGVLLSVGLVNIGFSEEPCRVAISLLTVLQGFELGYLWMEQSLLLIGLMAAADLAIVLSMITLFSLSQPGHSEEVNP